MRFKFFTLIAAAVLLAACASEPEESAATTSAGTAVGSGSGTSASTTALPSLDPRSQEWLVVNVGDRVFFDFDKSDLTPEAQDTVEKELVTSDIRINCEVPADHLYEFVINGQNISRASGESKIIGSEPVRYYVE